MQELKVIENNLVPVYETSDGEKVVYGSELYEVLDVKSNYRDWVKNRLGDCEAIENEDFQIFAKNLAKGRPAQDHIIKLDTAKEMAMLERNEKGKQVRKYFIAVEKKYNRMKVPMTVPEQIQLLAMGNVELNQKVENLDKKIDRLELDLPILGIEIDRITTAVHKKGVECLGGKDSEAYRDKTLHGKVFNDIYRELKHQFGISGTYKAIKRSQCDLAVSIIEGYQLPYVLLEQVQFKNSQLGLFCNTSGQFA